jgi:hypothetical protein
MKRDSIIRTLEANAERIRSFGVTRLALFGSHARGDAKRGSDLDFLVEFAEGRGLFDDYIGLYHLLEDLFQCKIDLVRRHLIREELRDDILGGVLLEAAI